MRWGIAVVILCASTLARANGRSPATVDIHFRKLAKPATEARPAGDVLVGTTFGLLVSHDGGATWRWMCEQAVGYGGIYDPDYEWTPAGSIFATTYGGLVVDRDGCTFSPTSLGSLVVSQIALAPDGTLFAAAADPSSSAIYASHDDGVTFDQLSAPAAPGTWWETMEVAPSDPQRIYLTGHRILSQDPMRPPLGSDAPEAIKELLLYRSDDGGHTFTKLGIRSFRPRSIDSELEIAAIDAADPDLVFVRVTSEHGVAGDAIYRSADAGLTWTRVLAAADSLHAFVARADGTIVAATAMTTSMFVSKDHGLTFQPVPTDRKLACMVEDGQGAVWACADNWGPGGMAIGKTVDLSTWKTEVHYRFLDGPVQCADGTVQHDVCAARTWCGIAEQFGIATQGCSLAREAPPPRRGGGCCDAGGAPGTALTGILVALVLGCRRRWQGRRGERAD